MLVSDTAIVTQQIASSSTSWTDDEGADVRPVRWGRYGKDCGSSRRCEKGRAVVVEGRSACSGREGRADDDRHAWVCGGEEVTTL